MICKISAESITVKAETKTPKELKELVEKREQARKNKDFKLADQLREKIKSLGYCIDDTKDGYIIKRL